MVSSVREDVFQPCVAGVVLQQYSRSSTNSTPPTDSPTHPPCAEAQQHVQQCMITSTNSLLVACWDYMFLRSLVVSGIGDV